jgi:hypothetical protein
VLFALNMYSRRLAVVATVLFGLSVGCGNENGVTTQADGGTPFDFGMPPTERVSLVTGENWSFVSQYNDPYRTGDTDAPPCTRIAFRPEYGGVELDTGICNHITLSQSASVAVAQGARVYITGWHSTLASNEPGTGYMRLMFGDQEVWSTESMIPGSARSFDETIINPVERLPGDPVYLHVRNHGANTWNILSIKTDEESD